MIALCVLKLNPRMFKQCLCLRAAYAMLGAEMNYWVLLFSSENELALRIGLIEVDKSDWLET